MVCLSIWMLLLPNIVKMVKVTRRCNFQYETAQRDANMLACDTTGLKDYSEVTVGYDYDLPTCLQHQRPSLIR
jgi:hypothetical protein